MRSHSLVFADFQTPWYKRWAKALKQDNDHLDGHKLKANKFWQNAVITQSLYEHGVLEPGKRGVGFGVGQERLPALFAKLGVKVTATDQAVSRDNAKHWEAHELATGLKSLNKLGICPPDRFKANVEFEPVNMKKVPAKLFNTYDFVWSNCALGHLGSLAAGLHFIIESAKCLRPGGIAVHTTEVNVLSNDQTVDSGDTVIFRPRDIDELYKRLKAAGFQLSPLVLNFGDTEADRTIDMRPQFGNDHSKLQVGGHLITQVVLVITRPTDRGSSVVNDLKQKQAYRANLRAQKRFAKQHKFLQAIRQAEAAGLKAGLIKPLRTNYSLTLKQPKELYVEYQNVSSWPLFGLEARFHTTKPLTIATADPQDRASRFKAKDWVNNQPNRPPFRFYQKVGSHWQEIDYIKPGDKFAFRLTLHPHAVKPGVYTEKFMLVQEGNQFLADTEVAVKVTVG